MTEDRMARKAIGRTRQKKTAVKKVGRPPKKAAKAASSALNTAMAHVKISFVEVLDAYKRKQEARLAALDELIEGAEEGRGAKSFTKQRGEKLAKKLSSLKVKPKKGRGKDLVRIEALLEELMETIDKE